MRYKNSKIKTNPILVWVQRHGKSWLKINYVQYNNFDSMPHKKCSIFLPLITSFSLRLLKLNFLISFSAKLR
jgi:hypothetical protein